MKCFHLSLAILLCSKAEGFLGIMKLKRLPHSPIKTFGAAEDSAEGSGGGAGGIQLSLEEVAAKLKFDVTDLDEGRYGLESKDAAYAIEIMKVQLPLQPSLGIGLEELRRGRDGRGLVLVSSLDPEGNAAKSGRVYVGDMLCWVEDQRVEGRDLDETMGELRSHVSSGAKSVTLLVKRLVFRKTIEVTFSYAGDKETGEEPWTSSMEMLAGSNLRKEMLRQGLPVYARGTKRFDQPFVTGECAGEGLCGTCLVKVLEGKELLNEVDGVEDMVLKKWNAVNWRLSCRTVIGAVNEAGKIRLEVTPQKPFIKKK